LVAVTRVQQVLSSNRPQSKGIVMSSYGFSSVVVSMIVSVVCGCAGSSTPSADTLSTAGTNSVRDASLDSPPENAPPLVRGDSSAGAPPGVDAAPEPGCAKAQYAAHFKPLDMLILLDQSGSMTEDEDRWTPVTKAIKQFVTSQEAAGLGVGLQYFPLGKDDDSKCDMDSYATPAVALRSLPDNAQAMVTSIDAHYFSKDECCDTPEHSGTPTRPAMEGVIAYMRGWLSKYPDHRGVILLATDGEPSSVCDGNKVADVAKVMKDAVNHSPSLTSYVIGIGENDKLEDLAAAGGTGSAALIVDGTGVHTERDLLAALAKVRGEAVSCDFPLPDAVAADRAHVNVQQRRAQGAPLTLVQVPNQAGCAQVDQPAWYYATPASTQLSLCPVTCSEVLADSSTTLEIVLGCASVLF
jgi:hypothetical protein